MNEILPYGRSGESIFSLSFIENAGTTARHTVNLSSNSATITSEHHLFTVPKYNEFLLNLTGMTRRDCRSQTNFMERYRICSTLVTRIEENSAFTIHIKYLIAPLPSLASSEASF